MSIIGKVGRRSRKLILLNSCLHIVLVLGAITMIYPFLLMISSSFKSAVDNTRLSLIPQYFHDDQALYQKYLESRYNEESSRLMDNYPGSWISFAEVQLPPDPSPVIGQHWQDFLKEHPESYSLYSYYVAEHYGRGVYPLAQRQYRGILRQENDKDIGQFNRRYNTGAASWEEIVVEEKEIFRRNFVSSNEGYLGRFREFKAKSLAWMRLFVNPDGSFVNTVLIPHYLNGLEEFNQIHGTAYQSWDQISLPTSCPPPGDPLREHWLHYARDVLNIQHLGLQQGAEAGFREMAKDKYHSVELLNTTWNTDFASFNQITIPDQLPDSGALVQDLSFFIQNLASPEQIRIKSIAEDFRIYLSDRYQDIGAFNRATGRNYKSFAEIAFPAHEQDYFAFTERKSAIRWEFIWRNYAMAFDQMLADARSLRNTGIYVLLSILLAITVNPLAAYALSRFKPRFSYQIIMLFMLTMAFPAMVMGIPNFLMLKRLNMLNTFWALVLPAAADGYFIFLLKGFFDSLPSEIFESARIDGAGEFRLFWQFTLFLSKPILAVIALGAFNAAYRNFLFAFIVCQDRSMWTLMVHIYELMQRASPGVGYAALVIAAVPTLAIFIFFQNIIIKGIVIPMEK
jgi:ABC-type glycerol-3-phosphate transport system permease component